MAATATSAPAYGPAGEARGSQPIAAYGLLADCNSAALVARDGSIDWFCLPRYDSGSVFGRILDPAAGHWSIRPTAEFTSERRYLPGSLVVETTFTTATGTTKLTDALVFAAGQRGHDLGFDAPHELVRSVEAVSGEVELMLELAPRTEYGLVRPLFRMEGDGGRTFGGPNRIVVRAGVPIEIEDVTMRAAFTVFAGDQVGFSLRWVPTEAHQVPAADRAGCGRGADRGHRRGLALLGGRPRHLRGTASRARASERSRAEGAHLPADRRDRRSADDLAAGDGRRRAELGLPLLLDPRRQPDARGAVHRQLQRRGRGVRLVHDELGRRRRVAADHVRDRRRARPDRARADAPARLAGLPSRAGRERRLGPDAARRLRRVAERPLPLPRAARRPTPRDPGVRRVPGRHGGPALARDATPACGRCGANLAITFRRRCCAGSRSTEP